MFTILSLPEIEKNPILYEVGWKCKLTYFALLHGIYYTDDNTSWWYTSTLDSDGMLKTINENGRICQNSYLTKRSGGVRVVLKYDKDVYDKMTVKDKRFLIVEYGEYPQKAVNKELSDELWQSYHDNSLLETGKVYTTDSHYWNDFCEPFKPIESIEYYYKGKKYAKVKAIRNNETKPGLECEDGNEYWVEVSPIEWYIDKENKILISKELLISGLRCTNNNGKYNGNFKKTEMYYFLNKIFAKDLVPSFVEEKIKENDFEESTPENIKIRELNKIVDNITGYLKCYEGPEDIMEMVHKAEDEYNRKIDLISKAKRTNTFLFEAQTEEELYNELINKLNYILDSLMTYFNKISKCITMSEIVEESIKVINNQESEEIDSELYRDLKTIGKIVLPFLDKKESSNIKNSLETILKKYLSETTRYMQEMLVFGDDSSKEFKYKAPLELEISIRKDIMSILTKMSKYVCRKDLIDSINKGINDSLQSNYIDGKNKALNAYLKIIDEAISSIRSMIKTDRKNYVFYEEELNRITGINLDYSMSDENIYKKLFAIYIELYKLANNLSSEIETNKWKIKKRRLA